MGDLTATQRRALDGVAAPSLGGRRTTRPRVTGLKSTQGARLVELAAILPPLPTRRQVPNSPLPWVRHQGQAPLKPRPTGLCTTLLGLSTVRRGCQPFARTRTRTARTPSFLSLSLSLKGREGRKWCRAASDAGFQMLGFQFKPKRNPSRAASWGLSRLFTTCAIMVRHGRWSA